jgi:hypothetical protein
MDNILNKRSWMPGAGEQRHYNMSVAGDVKSPLPQPRPGELNATVTLISRDRHFSQID